MNGLHCTCCRCTSMQDEPNLPEGSLRSGYYPEHAITSRQEGHSFPYDVTNGHWLWKTSRPEVINADLKDSFDPSNTLFCLNTPSVSSLGDLVCPASAVSASQDSKLFGTEFSLLNGTLSQIGLDNCTNQAPGRDGQTKDISQGLAYINHGHMQPCRTPQVFDPFPMQLETIAVDELPVDIQPPLRNNIPYLFDPARQLSTYLFESPVDGSLEIASSAAQDLSFINLGDTVSFEDVCDQSSLYAMSDAQQILELQSLLEQTLDDARNPSARQQLFSELATNPSDWYDEGHDSVDGQTPTPSQGDQSPAGIPAILSSSSQGKGKTKMISVYCCPHRDCDYTAKIWRDVERHLGSQKHGGSSLRFPCTVEGCNALKENTRRDNLRRHMKTVHGVIMPEIRKGRREKRYRVQSQAQQ
ncbi:hypothetical protein E8E14_014493 [Neopestalotiopsis sp. 37M]|nr:hypothetical protein E8E14_014493 [Neopestalotiopsis sp. 37M]